MPSLLVEKLPTLDEVEQELSRNAREASLLRSLRRALKLKQDRERVSERLRQSAPPTRDRGALLPGI